MNLWRLEWLRLIRTRRWMVVGGVYAFFGLLGPLTARYLGQIIQQAGAGAQLNVPDPVPADGITQFASNAGQIGVLTVIVIAAQALGLDNRPELAAFFRTRVQRAAALLIPRVVVASLAAWAALVVGTLAAWYETTILLGSLPAGRLWLGVALGSAYLGLVVLLTAAVTTITGSTLTTVLLVVGILLGLPLMTLIPGVRPWLPSELAGALDGLVRDRDPSEYVRAMLVTLVSGGGLWWLAVRRFSLREI